MQKWRGAEITETDIVNYYKRIHSSCRLTIKLNSGMCQTCQVRGISLINLLPMALS